MAAGKVAVIKSEYSKLESGLAGVHEDCISQIESVVSSLEALNTKGGGFYTDNISEKISALIGELNSVKASMSNLYFETEEIITSFQNVVDDYDTFE